MVLTGPKRDLRLNLPLSPIFRDVDIICQNGWAMASDEVELRIPVDRMYTLEHLWMQATDGRWMIGISDFLRAHLGDILRLHLPHSTSDDGEETGEHEDDDEEEPVEIVAEVDDDEKLDETKVQWAVEAGNDLLAVWSSRDKMSIPIPFEAEVLEFNAEVLNNPELVNEDPYGEGWVVIVRSLEADVEDMLLDADDYIEALEELLG